MRVSQAEERPRLAIAVQVENDRDRLLLTGELDSATAPRLENTVERRLTEANEIVLDLHQLFFVDSMGLRAILTCKELCRRNACGFALTEGPEHVQQLFETCGLLDRLPFVEGE